VSTPTRMGAAAAPDRGMHPWCGSPPASILRCMHHAATPRLGGGPAILRPALPYLVPVPAATVAATFGVVSRPALVAVLMSAALCALIRASIESIRIELLRDRADAWILAHAAGQPTDEIVLWRMRELADPRTRARLATSIRVIADTSDLAGWNRPYPNRRRIRAHRHELRRLARELGDLSRPVNPRGVALAQRLLTAAGGPLHDPHGADDLSDAVRDTIAALDGAEDHC
jgi:hypothetical protein